MRNTFLYILNVTLFLFLFVGSTYAGCSVSVSPSEAVINNSTDLYFRVENTGTNPIQFVKIPTGFDSNVSVTNASATGWDLSLVSGGFGMVYGSITSGSSATFTVSTNIGGTTGNSDWSLEASEAGDGSDTFTCNTVSVNIVEVASPTPTPEPTSTPVPVPVISNTSLSVGNSSATLSWNTDLAATGIVSYGITSSYGSSLTTPSSTAHSVSMTSLSSSTIYHYQIVVTGAGGIVTTNDATFTTSAASVTTTTTTTVTNTVQTTVSTTVTRTLSDTSAPTISLKTDLSKPLADSPTIIGSAADSGTVNAGIASIEYSMDGGKNWLPVDNITGLGKKSATFEFTPSRLDDGNYLIKMRAKDISGNVGMSNLYTLIIDRLPPQVGGSLFALGPMILRPNSNGLIYSIAGLPLKVILSAVGGPISMDLSYDSAKFTLIKNVESGLWNGLVNITTPGSFALKIKSIDGAKNETERKLSTIVALAPGKVTDENGKPIPKAKVNIYTFEKTTNDFTLWEAEPFMQQNPQETDADGEYRSILPTGKYYIEVEAPSKRKLRTAIFEVEDSTPINQNFTMEKSPFWGRFWSKTIPVNLVNIKTTESTSNPLVGKLIPDFDLSTSTTLFSSTSILGKPTVISFISSWEPQTSDQLLALDKFKSDNAGINTFAVAVQESISKTDIFQKTGGYQVPIIADADGILVLPLNIESLPTHLIVDRKGIIKEVVTGYIDDINLLNKVIK